MEGQRAILVHVRANKIRHALRVKTAERIAKHAAAWQAIDREHMKDGLALSEALNAPLLLTTYEDMQENMTAVKKNIWRALNLIEPPIQYSRAQIPFKVSSDAPLPQSLVWKLQNTNQTCLNEMINATHADFLQIGASNERGSSH